MVRPQGSQMKEQETAARSPERIYVKTGDAGMQQWLNSTKPKLPTQCTTFNTTDKSLWPESWVEITDNCVKMMEV